MTITLKLKPEVIAGLRCKAKQQGMSMFAYLQFILERDAQTVMPQNEKALILLKQWDAEDETDDLQELARRQTEWAEYQKRMNAAHSFDRVIYP